MKTKLFIGALLVFGLALAGGTNAAFAQGPTGTAPVFINPDDYTVSLIDGAVPASTFAAAPALVPEQVVTAPVFINPDDYSMSLNSVAAPEPSSVNADPDSYTVPMNIIVAPEPSSVNPDPDAYSTTFTDQQLRIMETQLVDSYLD